MTACYNHFALNMTKAEASAMSHRGDCEADVRAHLALPKFRRQFAKIDPDDIRAELKESGAWDAEELADHEENCVRMLWVAACDIREGR